MTRKDDAAFLMHRLYLLGNMFGKQARYIYVSGVYDALLTSPIPSCHLLYSSQREWEEP